MSIRFMSWRRKARATQANRIKSNLYGPQDVNLDRPSRNSQFALQLRSRQPNDECNKDMHPLAAPRPLCWSAVHHPTE